MSEPQESSPAPNLQSQSHRDLLDLIDKLRSNDIRRYIDLPQIVVCGDQSSGKSSVLEALSGHSFPAKENLCTRFATELVLRRAPEEAVIITITPGANRNEAEKKHLAAFKRTRSGDSIDLAQIIEEAKNHLGINDGHNEESIVADILRVDISGPNQPHLTMVDLPGLFKAGSHDQSQTAAPTVEKLVLSYMQKPRTIILAVVSAKNDYNNQEVTEHAKRLDPLGERTLVLITKPDTVDVRSPSETKWIKFASNKDVVFRLGWHVLRNRKWDERTLTIQQRNDEEKKFFSSGAWADLDPSHVGVDALRLRLSQLLKDQIILQLPDVKLDVVNAIADAREKLGKLGPCRESIGQQRKYLRDVSHKLTNLVTYSVDGNYGDPFFKSCGLDNFIDPRRLQAVVRDISFTFTKTMKEDGHTWTIVDDHKTTGPRHINREVFVEKKVKKMLECGRGRELPGTYNQNTVTDLFHNQAEPWENIVDDYVDDLVKAAFKAMDYIIRYAADEHTANAIIKYIDSSKLALQRQVEAEAYKIWQANTGSHPVTYNKQFTDNLWKAQRRAHEHSLRLALKSYISEDGTRINAGLDAIIDAITDRKTDPNMERYASLQAIYTMEAYYEVAREHLIDDMAKLVIEGTLLKNLPTLFDHNCVSELDDETIKLIAGEPEASAVERSRLTEKLLVLEAGLSELRYLERYHPVAPEPPAVEITSPTSAVIDSFARFDISNDNQASKESSTHKGTSGSRNIITPRKAKLSNSIMDSDSEEELRTPNTGVRTSPNFTTERTSSFSGYREASPSPRPSKLPTTDPSAGLFGGAFASPGRKN